jgi:hypothetical protein
MIRRALLAASLMVAVVGAISWEFLYETRAQVTGCTLPEVLQNGTVADANQVMNNFNALAGCLNNLSPGVRLTPQVFGAVGDGGTDDTAAVQAAINGAAAAGVPLYFDTLHKYLITAALNITAPISIEGQLRYGGWTAQDPTGSSSRACPWGLINNATGIDMLNVTAVTATIVGLCIQMSATDGTNPTAGAAMRFGPPVGKYQSGLRVEYNTIIRPFDGIAVGGRANSVDCCGKDSTADGNVFNRNSIYSPADEGISNGKFTVQAASPGNTYNDNLIICPTITGPAPANSVGFALYDGGISYDGTQNGPEGCHIGFKIAPGAIGGVAQEAGGLFRGVFGDQSGLNDLLIQPTDPLGGVIDMQSTGSWAAATLNKTSVLIDCSTGSCVNLSFVQFTVHAGAAQSMPVMKLKSSGTGGFFDFSLVDSSICGYLGAPPVAGAEALDINLSNTNSAIGRFLISGNRFNTCPGTALPVGIALHFTNTATGVGPPIRPNFIITNNDFSAVADAGGMPISYTPNNESIVISNNVGIENMTGTVADAATLSLPDVNHPTFAITGSGTDVTNLLGGASGKWYQNGLIHIVTPAAAINFIGTGGATSNICNSVTSVAGSFLVGRWNVASSCFNLH